MGELTPRNDGGNVRDEQAEGFDTRIARRYAHFHRVLGDLLLDLGKSATTHWLTHDRHRVTDEPTENRYAKAVYVLRDLSTVGPRLAELRDVQADAMRLIGNAEPTQSLLLPKVCERVTEARILENIGFASRARKRADVLARLARQRDVAESALETFSSYPSRLEKQVELQAELAELERGLRALRASDALTLREHYRYPRWMCHVYYEDPDAFDQLYVGDVGVILQGRNADVRRHDPKRRKHRRTEGVEPLVAVGPYVFYDEGEWRAARERA